VVFIKIFRIVHEQTDRLQNSNLQPNEQISTRNLPKTRHRKTLNRAAAYKHKLHKRATTAKILKESNTNFPSVGY
jgi:hypothetical protein